MNAPGNGHPKCRSRQAAGKLELPSPLKFETVVVRQQHGTVTDVARTFGTLRFVRGRVRLHSTFEPFKIERHHGQVTHQHTASAANRMRSPIRAQATEAVGRKTNMAPMQAAQSDLQHVDDLCSGTLASKRSASSTKCKQRESAIVRASSL